MTSARCNLAIAATLTLAGCATSQAAATAAYVQTTRAVVDTTLSAYVVLAEQGAALCERYTDAVQFSDCVAKLHVEEVTAVARAIVAAQEAFLSAYNVEDVVGMARAVADLTTVIARLKGVINAVHRSRGS